jgi:hypothetical protein
MQIRPKILLDYGRQNQPIRVPIQDLLQNAPSTFLTADLASGSPSATVQSINSLAINEVIFIGTTGVETSEIIKTHASTAPSGFTVTFASNTVQTHPSSSYLYVIPFDQVEISYATTLTGSKGVLTTKNIAPDALETTYNDVSGSTGYYFARFKNSITSQFSPYSDGVPISGYPMNSARSIIDKAKKMINKENSTLLTDDYAFGEIDNCQMEVVREYKRWSFLQVFGATTEATVGSWRIPVPLDLDDTNTNKSIYNFSLNGNPMTWIDKEGWNKVVQGVFWTTLAAQGNINDTTLTLTDSSNMAASGTVTIGANTYTYTANNTTTGVLSGVPALTAIILAGSEVFQNGSFTTPQYYTIFAGFVWHYPAVPTTLANTDYSMDYYSAPQPIYNDTDTIVLPDATAVIYYLAWKFLLRIQNGEENAASAAMNQKFEMRVERMKQKESMNRKIVMKPKASLLTPLNEGVNYPNDKWIRTQGFL